MGHGTYIFTTTLKRQLVCALFYYFLLFNLSFACYVTLGYYLSTLTQNSLLYLHTFYFHLANMSNRNDAPQAQAEMEVIIIDDDDDAIPAEADANEAAPADVLIAVVQVDIVGLRHHQGSTIVQSDGDELSMEVELNNRHDPLAVKVLNHASHQVGYVARDNKKSDVAGILLQLGRLSEHNSTQLARYDCSWIKRNYGGYSGTARMRFFADPANAQEAASRLRDTLANWPDSKKHFY